MKFSMMLAVMVGGAIGATLRYSLSGFAQKFTDSDFPLGTLAVNLLGCFLIGVLTGTAVSVSLLPSIRVLVISGGLGALTTFSTYALESINLWQRGQKQTAVFNILLNNGGGLCLVFLCFWLTH